MEAGVLPLYPYPVYRYKEWFPERVMSCYERRESTAYNVYVEQQCRTKRCYDSPLFYMMRLLNANPKNQEEMYAVPQVVNNNAEM